jgi:hypothetical protein
MCSSGSVTASCSIYRLEGDGDALALIGGSWSQPLYCFKPFSWGTSLCMRRRFW